MLSGFDPVRREIARLAHHQLVADGRIHPARIEEVVTKVRKLAEEEVIETGKRTAIDLGIHGLHPELIRLIGKMKYRLAMARTCCNTRETANLCVPSWPQSRIESQEGASAAPAYAMTDADGARCPTMSPNCRTPPWA